MLNKSLLVGVTGGIGSGKSTVCKIFEVLGHYVFYADDKAKWLMNHDRELRMKIIDLFGEEAYRNGSLNREYIGGRVFNNMPLLGKLNALVHPAVARNLKEWVSENESQDLLFYEAALMFETGSHKKMSAAILVTAPEQLRIQRVLKRDVHRTEEAIRSIIDNQMDDQKKIPLADYVIDNSEEKSVIMQTLRIYDQVLSHYK